MTQKLSYIYWSKRSSGDGHDPDAERTQQVRLAGAGAGAAGGVYVAIWRYRTRGTCFAIQMNCPILPRLR